MSGSTHHDSDRGVSPVVGIVLLIAITFMLAGTVAAFAFGIGEATQRPDPPTAVLEFEYEPAPSGDELTVSHLSGEVLDPERIDVAITGADCTPGYDPNRRWNAAGDFGVTGEFSAGRTLTIDPGDPQPCAGNLDLSDATVHVTWSTERGSSTTLRTWNGPG